MQGTLHGLYFAVFIGLLGKCSGLRWLLQRQGRGRPPQVSEGRAFQAGGECPRWKLAGIGNNRGYSVVISKEHSAGKTDQRGVCVVGGSAIAESAAEEQCDSASSFRGSLWLFCAEHTVGRVQRTSVEVGAVQRLCSNPGESDSGWARAQAAEVGFWVYSEEGPLDGWWVFPGSSAHLCCALSMFLTPLICLSFQSLYSYGLVAWNNCI